jgi:hypothetical protein
VGTRGVVGSGAGAARAGAALGLARGEGAALGVGRGATGVGVALGVGVGVGVRVSRGWVRNGRSGSTGPCTRGLPLAVGVGLGGRLNPPGALDCAAAGAAAARAKLDTIRLAAEWVLIAPGATV